MLQYVNPMAINTWALAERYPDVKQVGLCHSVQNTVQEIAHDLDMAQSDIRYRVAGGVNHVAFFLKLEDAAGRSLYPALRDGYRAGRLPKAPPLLMPRCPPNNVRYEVMAQLGYFCTESSEHLAEYVPWFIKQGGRDDLIRDFGIPLDEYPKRCIEQQAAWKEQAAALNQAASIDVPKSHEFAAEMMNAVITDSAYVPMATCPTPASCRNCPPWARRSKPPPAWWMQTACSPAWSPTFRRS